MRDGAASKPEPPSFEEIAALARRILAGEELHYGAQIQLLIVSEGFLRLYEQRGMR